MAILLTEEDIASSFEELVDDDLFFFFGSLWLSVQDILSILFSSLPCSPSFCHIPTREKSHTFSPLT
jgi:hypothetical protein